MKVTIAILCYNYARYLGQAIDSALMQAAAGSEIEVLVIDDGSTDNTAEVCRRYQGRIRVISQGNHGFASSITRAVKNSLGTVVFFLDADDYFLPGKVATFIPYFESGSLLVYDRVNMMREPNGSDDTYTANGGSTSTLAVSRHACMQLQPIENELSFHVFEDVGRGVKINQALTCYRLHSSSMTDRTRAGSQNLYLAGVTLRISDTLFVLAFSKDLPLWVKNRRQLFRVACAYRSRGYYNAVEASLELRMPLLSALSLSQMLLFAVLRPRGISLFDIKTVVKTFLNRPSFPKKPLE